MEVIGVFEVTLFKPQDIALHQCPEEHIPLQKGDLFKLIQKPSGHLALDWYCVIESWHVRSESNCAQLC